MRLSILAVAGVAGLFACPALAGGNLLLNGSFESNSAAGTTYNMANATFNTTVDDATAWGGSSEIDLMTFGGGFGTDPVDGAWSLALHARVDGAVDAFSFHLSQSISAGNSYDLSFFATANTSFDAGNAAVEIGISGDDTSFGTLVYSTGALPLDAFALFATTFVAPVSGDFLSVRGTGTSTWAHLDGFELTKTIPAPGALALLGVAGALGRGRRRR